MEYTMVHRHSAAVESAVRSAKLTMHESKDSMSKHSLARLDIETT